MRKTLISTVAAAALFAFPVAALAQAGGVGVGVTAGNHTVSASSAVNANNGPVIIGSGSYSATVGTQSTASNGMAIGAGQTNTFTVDTSQPGVTSTSSSVLNVATMEGFSTASSVSTITESQNGFVIGNANAASSGFGTASGAFLGVGLIAASAP